MVGEVHMTNAAGETDVAVVLHITHDDLGSVEDYSVEMMLTSLVAWWQATLSAIGVPGQEQFFPDAEASCAR